MKCFVTIGFIVGLSLGIVSFSFALPPSGPSPEFRVAPAPAPHIGPSPAPIPGPRFGPVPIPGGGIVTPRIGPPWVPPPRWIPPRHWAPSPGWRFRPPPWVVPPPWPRPPLPWFWAPPPPGVRNWWFWVWWEPLPIDFYYYAPEQVYYYEYYPYSYLPQYGTETGQYPTYTEQYGTNEQESQMPKINSPKDYEIWLAQSLNLTPEQQKVFLPKLRSLAELREEFVTDRTKMVSHIEKLQAEPNVSSAQLQKKLDELQAVDDKFREKEQKKMKDLLSELTVEQRAKFISQMNQYGSSQSGEKK